MSQPQSKARRIALVDSRELGKDHRNTKVGCWLSCAPIVVVFILLSITEIVVPVPVGMSFFFLAMITTVFGAIFLIISLFKNSKRKKPATRYLNLESNSIRIESGGSIPLEEFPRNEVAHVQHTPFYPNWDERPGKIKKPPTRIASGVLDDDLTQEHILTIAELPSNHLLIELENGRQIVYAVRFSSLYEIKQVERLLSKWIQD